MSTATVESPVNASQLFFAWSEQAEVGVAPVVSPRRQPQQSAPKRVSKATPNSHSTAPSPATAPSTPCQPQTTEHLSFTSDGRIEKPVRIGAVMIKLLKRYGISDQEIAEGIANYARKQQQAVAS